MKILIFSRGYPTRRKPLEGSFEVSQAKALCRAGHEVIVAYVRLRSFYRLRERGFYTWNKEGITVCEFSELFPIIPKLRHIPFTPLYAPEFISDAIYARAIRKLYAAIVGQFGTPDIVHSHYLFISGHLGFIKTQCRVPMVCTEHWSGVAQPIISKKTRKLGGIYGMADEVVAVSGALARKISDHFGVDSIVIPNLLDYSYLNDSKTNHTKRDNFSFITIGRLNEIKCYDLLIRAFSKARLPLSATLSIIGDGEEYERLNKIAADLGQSGRIHFLKQKSMEEINSLLGQYHVFVSSSRSETFGVVHIEAMAKGLPVLSTRSGGPEDFVTEEVGVLVEADHPEELAGGLERMHNEYDRYDAAVIRQYCIDKFSPEIVGRQLLDLYSSVLQEQINK